MIDYKIMSDINKNKNNKIIDYNIIDNKLTTDKIPQVFYQHYHLGYN